MTVSNKLADQLPAVSIDSGNTGAEEDKEEREGHANNVHVHKCWWNWTGAEVKTRQDGKEVLRMARGYGMICWYDM